MKTLLKAIGLMLLFELSVAAGEIFTRAQLFSAAAREQMKALKLNTLRYQVELDLDGSGTNALILSQSVSMGGTGGWVFDLYRPLPGDRFEKLDTFVCGEMAVESLSDSVAPRKRLWFAAHTSGGTAQLEYRQFDRDGELQKASIDLFTSQDGEGIGSGILDTVFSHRLKLVEVP